MDSYHLKAATIRTALLVGNIGKKLKLLLSLKWENRKGKSVAKLPLQSPINATNWYVASILKLLKVVISNFAVVHQVRPG